MDERARRRKIRDEGELMRGCGKGKRKNTKRDGPRESASQAVFDGVNTKKASKKINYDALQGAFGGDGSFRLPTQVVIDPSLNVYGTNSTRNIKPVIEKLSASTTYPFVPSTMRLSLQGHDKKVTPSIGQGPRKTFLMSESSSSKAVPSDAKDVKNVGLSKKDEKGEEIPLRAGVVTGKAVPAPVPVPTDDAVANDEEDMLMYDETGDNEDDYDDDEEY